MTTTEPNTIEVGMLVRDGYGHIGVVTGSDDPPAEWWLAQQEDQSLRECANEQWWIVAPLTGGEVSTPESRTEGLRCASPEDLKRCYGAANDFGKFELKRLFPNPLAREPWPK